MLAIVIDDEDEVCEDVVGVFPIGDVESCESYCSQQDFDERFLQDYRNRVRPSLIFVDVNLESADAGMDVVRSIRKKRTLKKIPIIMISHSDEPDDVHEAFHAGASLYIVKGEDPKQLPKAISTIVASGKFFNP